MQARKKTHRLILLLHLPYLQSLLHHSKIRIGEIGKRWITLKLGQFGRVSMRELSELAKQWSIVMKTALRLWSSIPETIVPSRSRGKIDLVEPAQFVSSHESSDVTVTPASYRSSTAFYSQNMALKTSNPCAAEQDRTELGNSQRKIILRHTTKASHTGSSKKKRIYYSYSSDYQSAHRMYYKNSAGYTIYYDKCSRKCPHKATGLSYTQVAVIEQGEDGDVRWRKRLPDNLRLAPFGFPWS